MIIAALFPGQGSQFVGMGQAAYEQFPTARAIFDQADNQLGFSLSRLCFNGPKAELTDTVNQQPALFTTSVALWQILVEQTNSLPRYLAGHSLGEFSALVAAGSISFSAGLDLVRKRGELMKTAGERAPGAMAAILALDVNSVTAICRQASDSTGFPVQLANDNCPGQLVISGHVTALSEAEALAKVAGAKKVIRLPITIAAHSSLMNPAAAAFSAAVDATPIAAPNIPVIGNVSAAPLQMAEDVRDELKRQLTSSVAWFDSMNYLLSQGIGEFIEVGPGGVLLGLVKRINRKVKRTEFEAVAANEDN